METSTPKEPKARLLHLGEVSPYKLLITLVIRENFSFPEVAEPTRRPFERIDNAIHLYRLLTSPDKSFDSLIAAVSDPPLRAETVRRFHESISTLNPENATWLYDLVHSCLEFNGGSVTVLKKNVSKNSPMGKYLRLTLHSLQKMSYPQILHVYRELCAYVGVGSSRPHPLTPVMVPSIRRTRSLTKKSLLTSMVKKMDISAKGKPKIGLDVFAQMLKSRLADGKSGLSPIIFNQYLFEKMKINKELKDDEEKAFGFWQMERKEKVRMALAGRDVKDTTTCSTVPMPSWKNLTTSSFPSPRKSPRKSEPHFISIVSTEDPAFLDTSGDGAPQRGSRNRAKISQVPKSRTKGVNLHQNLLGGSKRWADVKFWSRRLIESTVKAIADDLSIVGAHKYTPSEISSFVEAIKHNPSALNLLPQIYYLEYLNSLRLLDFSRATASLRTSFDLRIKPTNELNKGTPYAAFNLALFYNFVGCKPDAEMYLQEAFQAGHAAGDLNCLNHCLDLWGVVRGDGGSRNGATAGLEEKGMLDLHTRGMVRSAEAVHYEGAWPVELVEGLFDLINEQDAIEVEAMLLEVLISYFSIYGWIQMTSTLCQFILQSPQPWPSRSYAFALCSFAQCTLLAGDPARASAIMSHGRELFTLATPDSILFNMQEAMHLATIAHLSHSPIDQNVIATLSAYDPMEAQLHLAYNQMISNDFQSAGESLKGLTRGQVKTEDVIKDDLRLRSLILLAQVECLCENAMQGLGNLFEAMDLAVAVRSDFYIGLCTINIGLIQNHLNLPSTQAKSLHQGLRSILRSSTPFLQAKLNLLNIRLRLKSMDNVITTPGTMTRRMRSTRKSGTAELDRILLLLDQTQTIYAKWNDQYRIKEVLHLKSQVYGLGGRGMAGLAAECKAQADSIATHLFWSPETCVI